MGASLLAAFVCYTLASATGTAASVDNTVLVTELKAIAVSPDDATALTSDVAQSLAQDGGYRVMTVAEVNRMADLQKNLGKMGCADESCLAELYRIANASVEDASVRGLRWFCGPQRHLAVEWHQLEPGDTRYRPVGQVRTRPRV